MKAILEFDLDEPHDEEMFNVTSKASKLWGALYRMARVIDDLEKRREAEKKRDKTLKEIKEEFYGILEYEGISLEELS